MPNAILDSVDYPAIIFGRRHTIRQRTVELDTLNTDFTVHTPAAGSRIVILGLVGMDASAANLSIKRGASITPLTLEMGANSGPGFRVQAAPVAVLGTGDALILRTSAIINSLLVSFIETQGSLDFT